MDDRYLQRVRERMVDRDDLPPDFVIKRPIYHGTNSKFDTFDFDRGGGMVHFAEKPEYAQSYANDLGSGGRNRKTWADIRVEDLEKGDSFFYDPDIKLWISEDGKRKIPFKEFQEMMDSGNGHFEVYPKDARIIEGRATMSEVLDTYPDKRQPYSKQANKKGLEAFLDIVDPSKIENTANPQHTTYTQKIAERLKHAAHEELKGTPGAPGFGNEWWHRTKWARAEETNQALKGITGQLKDAGYSGIRFADDSHPTIAMFKEPEKLSILKRAMPGLKMFSKVLPYVSAGSALLAPTADAAAAELIGVESMGVSDEQRELDRRYQQRIRERAALIPPT